MTRFWCGCRWRRVRRSKNRSSRTLLRFGGRRRSRLRRGSGLICGHCAGSLRGIGLVVETNDVLGDIEVFCDIQNWGILNGGIKDCDVVVLLREAVENIHHFSADAVDDFPLRRADVFLILVSLAIKPLSQPSSLSGNASPFLFVQCRRACAQALLQIIHLLLQRFQLFLPRCELRVELSSCLLPFRGYTDRLEDVDDADLCSSA